MACHLTQISRGLPLLLLFSMAGQTEFNISGNRINTEITWFGAIDIQFSINEKKNQKKTESYFLSVSQTLSVTYFIEPWLQYLERPSFSSASASFLYYSFEVYSIHKKSRQVFKASVSNDFLEYYHVEEGCRGGGGGGINASCKNPFGIPLVFFFLILCYISRETVLF